MLQSGARPSPSWDALPAYVRSSSEDAHIHQQFVSEVLQAVAFLLVKLASVSRHVLVAKNLAALGVAVPAAEHN